MRRFVDLTFLDELPPVAERMGFFHILTLSHISPISGSEHGNAKRLSAAVQRARSARKLPVIIAEDADTLKNAARFSSVLVELRTRVDMQFATIARERGVLPIITLDFVRAHPKNIAIAAQSAVLLHRARVPFILATGARAPSDLRGPWEIAAVGRALGLSLPLSLAAVSNNWEPILERLPGVLP